jgi:hypothetical protein
MMIVVSVQIRLGRENIVDETCLEEMRKWRVKMTIDHFHASLAHRYSEGVSGGRGRVWDEARKCVTDTNARQCTEKRLSVKDALNSMIFSSIHSPSQMKMSLSSTRIEKSLMLIFTCSIILSTSSESRRCGKAILDKSVNFFNKIVT